MDHHAIHTVPVDGRLFRKAHRGQFGITEHRAGHKVVVHLSRPTAEGGIGKSAAFVDRHGREVDPVGDITNCIDVGNRRASHKTKLILRDLSIKNYFFSSITYPRI